MKKERRKGQPPVPKDCHLILNNQQKTVLSELLAFGWQINYIRRPLFLPTAIIIHDPRTGRQSIIREDGSVDHSPVDLATRGADR